MKYLTSLFKGANLPRHLGQPAPARGKLAPTLLILFSFFLSKLKVLDSQDYSGT